MSTKITAENLAEASQNGAAIKIEAQLVPSAGEYAPVAPPTFGGDLSAVHQFGKAWVENGDEPRVVDTILLDSVQSQANRLEQALRSLRAEGKIKVPELVVNFEEFDWLRVDLPRELSSFAWPSRNADAYLRDSERPGEPEFVKNIQNATAGNPGALYAWMPHALLFGFWHSVTDNGVTQAKLPRSYTSTIVGYEPALLEGRKYGTRVDPLNLQGKDASESGIGMIPWGGKSPVLAPVAFRRILQTSTVSFSGLRNISFEKDKDIEKDKAGRVLLAALALCGHTFAFSVGGVMLRSGADLVVATQEVTLVSGGGQQEMLPLTADAALELLNECYTKAVEAGVPLDGWGKDTVELKLKDGADTKKMLELTHLGGAPGAKNAKNAKGTSGVSAVTSESE